MHEAALERAGSNGTARAVISFDVNAVVRYHVTDRVQLRPERVGRDRRALAPRRPAMTSPLRDRCILVVEDEYAVAASLADALEIVGSAAVGPVPSVEKALEAIEREPLIDAAIVDVNLGGVLAYAVADRLLARNIPFIFTSGYGSDALRNRYPEIKNCQKPYRLEDIEQALSSAISEASRRANPLERIRNEPPA
jgi:CheY-like chemotaxis protein